MAKKPKTTLPKAVAVKVPGKGSTLTDEQRLELFQETVTRHATSKPAPLQKDRLGNEILPDVSEYLGLLGYQGKDRITGFSGVIACISFDLYGCVQAVISPPIDKEGKIVDGRFMDINRIEVTSKARVMPVPDFEPRPEAHEYGPADKPAYNK